MSKRFFFILVSICLLLLSYGYWHVSTHGWLYISLNRIVTEGRKYENIKNATVSLFDLKGRLLVNGRSDDKFGVVYLAHPEVGYCVEDVSKRSHTNETTQAWRDCYQKQSTWLFEWVRKVEYMDLEFKGCSLKKLPVTVSESKDDWWLWWVPHPHLGGKPITYFTISVYVDSEKCVETDI